MKSNTDKSTAKSKVAGTDTLDRQNSSEKIQQLDEFKSDAIRCLSNQYFIMVMLLGDRFAHAFILRMRA